MLLDYVEPESAEGKENELLKRDMEYYGVPSLFARALVNNPEVFEARTDYHNRIVLDGDIDNRIGELIYLAVSVTNECEYCTASHREVLSEHVGLPDKEVQALTGGDFSVFDERETVVLEFATQIASDPKRVSQDQVNTLREAGFEDSQVVRLLLMTTCAISANTIADALNILPADREEPFS